MMASPKVLVVGINPWVDNTGINTLINFFQNWGADRIAHIYTRDGLPSTHICNNFFQISESKLIKNLIGKTSAPGTRVQNTAGSIKSGKIDKTKSIYQKFGEVAFLAREIIWKLGRWESKELKEFLDEFSPDVLFFPTYSNVYMNRLQNFIADYCKKPVILYASDDNFSYKSISHRPLSLLHRAWVRKQLRRLFDRSAQVMVIAPKVKEEYDSLFGKDSVIMTKGIDFSDFPYTEKSIGSPLRIVYTGKLIYGRWKSLSALSAAVEQLNEKGNSIEFDIYTTDNLSESQENSLSHKGTTIKEPVPLSEVPRVLENADIVVFAESLDPKYKNLARLSLSTKITDYLRSGKCIFAIGDKEIAPIDYLRRNDAAVIADSYEEIGPRLMQLISKPASIIAYGKKAYDCARRNHDKKAQAAILADTVQKAMIQNNA